MIAYDGRNNLILTRPQKAPSRWSRFVACFSGSKIDGGNAEIGEAKSRQRLLKVKDWNIGFEAYYGPSVADHVMNRSKLRDRKILCIAANSSDSEFISLKKAQRMLSKAERQRAKIRVDNSRLVKALFDGKALVMTATLVKQGFPMPEGVKTWRDLMADNTEADELAKYIKHQVSMRTDFSRKSLKDCLPKICEDLVADFFAAKIQSSTEKAESSSDRPKTEQHAATSNVSSWRMTLSPEQVKLLQKFNTRGQSLSALPEAQQELVIRQAKFKEENQRVLCEAQDGSEIRQLLRENGFQENLETLAPYSRAFLRSCVENAFREHSHVELRALTSEEVSQCIKKATERFLGGLEQVIFKALPQCLQNELADVTVSLEGVPFPTENELMFLERYARQVLIEEVHGKWKAAPGQSVIDACKQAATFWVELATLEGQSREHIKEVLHKVCETQQKNVSAKFMRQEVQRLLLLDPFATKAGIKEKSLFHKVVDEVFDDMTERMDEIRRAGFSLVFMGQFSPHVIASQVEKAARTRVDHFYAEDVDSSTSIAEALFKSSRDLEQVVRDTVQDHLKGSRRILESPRLNAAQKFELLKEFAASGGLQADQLSMLEDLFKIAEIRQCTINSMFDGNVVGVLEGLLDGFEKREAELLQQLAKRVPSLFDADNKLKEPYASLIAPSIPEKKVEQLKSEAIELLGENPNTKLWPAFNILCQLMHACDKLEFPDAQKVREACEKMLRDFLKKSELPDQSIQRILGYVNQKNQKWLFDEQLKKSIFQCINERMIAWALKVEDRGINNVLKRANLNWRQVWPLHITNFIESELRSKVTMRQDFSTKCLTEDELDEYCKDVAKSIDVVEADSPLTRTVTEALEDGMAMALKSKGIILTVNWRDALPADTVVELVALIKENLPVKLLTKEEFKTFCDETVNRLKVSEINSKVLEKALSLEQIDRMLMAYHQDQWSYSLDAVERDVAPSELLLYLQAYSQKLAVESPHSRDKLLTIAEIKAITDKTLSFYQELYKALHLKLKWKDDVRTQLHTFLPSLATLSDSEADGLRTQALKALVMVQEKTNRR